MSEIDFRGPVDSVALSAPDGAITLADESSCTKVLVRGARKTAAGIHLKVTYGRSRRRKDGVLVCGSRPGEWTLLAEPGRSGDVAESIPSEGFVSIVDITHGRAMLRISGRDAVGALAKVCNVDLADDMTPDGAVFSGSVAKVTCDLVRDDRDGERSYLISCERSFGRYLFSAVADACVEFGVDMPPGLSIH
ncbi:MAG: hypothetical protein ISR43_02410 [Acidimicrobiia bacterium]|nr:hypothetical protein [Actinomycetota bacterium]MBL6923932.1 hypothetical protein [Acidimicrobiia bacterium]MBL6926067.1 hypothetical protein [Acidimicrobiia bacterium]